MLTHSLVLCNVKPYCVAQLRFYTSGIVVPIFWEVFANCQRLPVALLAMLASYMRSTTHHIQPFLNIQKVEQLLEFIG